MIYVFKTSVFSENEILLLKPHLDKLPRTKWNFDLEDCDKILRIESSSRISEKMIMNLLNDNGYDCQALL